MIESKYRGKPGRDGRGRFAAPTEESAVVVVKATVLTRLADALRDAAREKSRRDAIARRRKVERDAYLRRRSRREAKRCNATTAEAPLTHSPFEALKGVS